jgi:hypothetical protein
LVSIEVNVGAAVFPRDGTTAAELAQAAERGIRKA